MTTTRKRDAAAEAVARLDDVDRAILRLLQANGKMTNTDLADQVGLSPPSTLERVRKLERSGVIRGYAALLDAPALGVKTMAIVHVSLREHGRQPLNAVKKALSSLDDVQACWHTAGEDDFILKVVVQDMDAYEDFVTNRLSAITGIGRIRTTFILNTCKEETALPIPEPDA